MFVALSFYSTLKETAVLNIYNNLGISWLLSLYERKREKSCLVVEVVACFQPILIFHV